MICLSCGATNDLEDDSSTCWGCFDQNAEFEPKYGLARGLPRDSEQVPGGGCAQGEDDGASAIFSGNGDRAYDLVNSTSGLKNVSFRQQERELWLQKERQRLEEALTVEDLLPSRIFSRNRRRDVESEYGVDPVDALTAERHRSNGVLGEGINVDVGVNSRLGNQVPRENNHGTGIWSEFEEEADASESDIALEGVTRGEVHRDDAASDRAAVSQIDVETQRNELEALRQSVYDALPSKVEKEAWLRRQQEGMERIGLGEGDEDGISSRGDTDSSFDRSDRRGQMGPSSIPTLRQAKARAKAAVDSQVLILQVSVSKMFGA